MMTMLASSARARDRRPLGHPGGELVGHVLRVLGQPDEAQRLHRHLVDPLRRPARTALAQRRGDVLVDVQRKEQAAGERQGALEHDGHVRAHLVQLRIGEAREVLAVEPDDALRRVDQADDVVDGDGLAGAGRPQQARDRASRHHEVDAV